MRDRSLDATPSRERRFRTFCVEIEPGLRRALVAAYGPEPGSEAAADALAWAWEHFERVEAMENAAGYLWRVGQTSVRRNRSRPVPPHRAVETDAVEIEPALDHALDRLSERQRVAVLLVHGYGYSLSEAAEQMDCRIRTLRHHLDRGLAKLRADLGVTDA